MQENDTTNAGLKLMDVHDKEHVVSHKFSVMESLTKYNIEWQAIIEVQKSNTVTFRRGLETG